MKKLFVILTSLLFAFQVQAQQSAKRYAVKSGKIEYKLTGNTTGTKTVYFNNYGNKHYEHEKSVTVTKVFGISDRSETDKITIIDNDYFWTIDNIENKNYEGEMPYAKLGKQITADMTEAEQGKMADDILQSFGGQRLGTEKVLGFICEKMSLMGSTIWIYNGISLKTETKVMGIVANEEAVSFEEDIRIPDSRFVPPTGIDFTNVRQQQNPMFQGMNMEMYEEDDYEEDDVVAVTYPFEDFKKEMNSFKPEGYTLMMVLSQDGQHIALFTRGMTNVVSVMATSDKNMEDIDNDEMNEFETFTHKGKTMRYGDLSNDDMDGKALIIPYKEHDMYIILMSVPGKDKNTLLEWADEFDF